jgi:hypothetical protein
MNNFNEYKKYINEIIHRINQNKHVFRIDEDDISNALLSYEDESNLTVGYDENIAVRFLYDVERNKMSLKIMSPEVIGDDIRVMTLESLITVSMASEVPLSFFTFKVKNYINDVYLTYSFKELEGITLSNDEEAYAIPF